MKTGLLRPGNVLNANPPANGETQINKYLNKRCKICGQSGHYKSTCVILKREEALRSQLAKLHSQVATIPPRYDPTASAPAALQKFLDQTKPKKAARGCSICGSSSHYRTTCPNLDNRDGSASSISLFPTSTDSESKPRKDCPVRVRMYLQDRLNADPNLKWMKLRNEFECTSIMKELWESWDPVKVKNLFQNLKHGKYLQKRIALAKKPQQVGQQEERDDPSPRAN